jgi:hypothetical protein
MRRDPIVIGGTGGSGTSIVARTLQRLGLDIGDLEPDQSEWRPMGHIIQRYGRSIVEHELDPTSTDELLETKHRFKRVSKRHPGQGNSGPWGWKWPQSYLIIPFLVEVFPKMRFLLVVRDGRDMALSANKRAVRKFGDLFLGSSGEPTNAHAAEFWLVSNEWAMEQGDRLGTRFLAVRFESLVFHPAETLVELARFCGLTPSQEDMDDAVAMVRPPAPAPNLPRASGPQIGRYRQLDPDEQAALGNVIGSDSAR